MRIPVTYIENIFDNPDEIVDYANTLEFWSKENHPGFRTDRLEDICPRLSNYLISVIVFQFFNGSNNISIESSNMYFQKIPYRSKGGIVHTDESAITAIVYLDKKYSSGTSVLKPKSFFTDWVTPQNNASEFFKTDVWSEEWEQTKNNFNSEFEELVTVHGAYNSAIIFNGWREHRMNMQPIDIDGDRLTMSCFLNKVHADVDIDERVELYKRTCRVV